MPFRSSKISVKYEEPVWMHTGPGHSPEIVDGDVTTLVYGGLVLWAGGGKLTLFNWTEGKEKCDVYRQGKVETIDLIALVREKCPEELDPEPADPLLLMVREIKAANPSLNSKQVYDVIVNERGISRACVSKHRGAAGGREARTRTETVRHEGGER